MSPSPDASEHRAGTCEGEAAALFGQNAIVGIGGGVLGDTGAESVALLHALENEIHTVLVLPFHVAQLGSQIIFFAHSFLGPLDGDLVIASGNCLPALSAPSASSPPVRGHAPDRCRCTCSHTISARPREIWDSRDEPSGEPRLAPTDRRAAHRNHHPSPPSPPP